MRSVGQAVCLCITALGVNVHFCRQACVRSSSAAAGRAIYSGLVLDLSSLDLEEIGNALADQTDYEHRWLINPQTGRIAFWTADTGIDGQTPVDLDECCGPADRDRVQADDQPEAFHLAGDGDHGWAGCRPQSARR